MENGLDPTGLGRWSWIQLTGDNEINTTVISEYSPCKPRKHSLLSTYAQQTIYWKLQGIGICAEDKCRLDIISFVRSVRVKGDMVVLMIDGNENMRNGKLAKALRAESINMRNPIRSRVGATKFPTWYRDQDQIDAICISGELQAQLVTFLPFFFSIGDHRGIVVDIPE